MATFVRPSDADLAAMTRRITGPLTPDGAEAWYRNDAAWLIQEVVYLRSELADARESFYGDATDHPGDNARLEDVAAWWREHVTGIWEKAQVKKLKDALVQSERSAGKLEGDLADAQRLLHEEQALRADADREIVEVNQSRQQDKQAFAQSTGSLMARITQLDDVIAQLRRELEEERKAGERNSTMTEALVGQKFGQVRELLQKAIELL